MPVSGEYDFFMIVQAESFAKMNRLMEDIQESHHDYQGSTNWQASIMVCGSNKQVGALA